MNGRVSIVAAMASNYVIGKGGEMPWHLPPDLARFKKITEGGAVVMGRKTFESILARNKRPLPNRLNIVITRQTGYRSGDCVIAHSLEAGLSLSEGRAIFIIGGGEIYEQAIRQDLVDRMFLTLIEKEYEGDTRFPEFNPLRWRCVEDEAFPVDTKKKQPAYQFLTFKRRAP